MRLQHIFKQLSEDLKAKEAAPQADSGASSGSYGYGDLDKVISKIGKALEKNKGKQKGIAVLDFGEPAVQMDLTVSLIISKQYFKFFLKNMSAPILNARN